MSDGESAPPEECFIISPIGPEDSSIRTRADLVRDFIIRPAAEACGFVALRGDSIAQPGMIARQVIDHVLNARMVVADLTGRNANVFYELAIRHATRKPLVKIAEVGEELPFDVAQSRTIFFDHTNLRSADYCRRALVEQMRAAIEGEHDADNPITAAIDFAAARRSDDPVERQIADLTASIALLANNVRRLNDRSPDSFASFESGYLAGVRSQPQKQESVIDYLTGPMMNPSILQKIREAEHMMARTNVFQDLSVQDRAALVKALGTDDAAVVSDLLTRRDPARSATGDE